MEKLISFDLKADFGFLKKPDTNEPVYITYNMLHKPALLGILGAIIGLNGFKILLETSSRKRRSYIPEYYEKLKNIKVGIQPLGHDNGNFQKTVIRYNNSVGYANKDGGTLIVDEQVLINPSYRCFLLLDISDHLQEKLFFYLKEVKAEYLPYLGKNDFSIWWESFQEYQGFELFDPAGKSFKLESLFIKEEILRTSVMRSEGFTIQAATKSKFMYFENLPVAYDPKLMQYQMQQFAYTDWELIYDYEITNLYKIFDDVIIQLF